MDFLLVTYKFSPLGSVSSESVFEKYNFAAVIFGGLFATAFIGLAICYLLNGRFHQAVVDLIKNLKNKSFLKTLAKHKPVETARFKQMSRECYFGLLSVGIKLHCSGSSARLAKVFSSNSEKPFRLESASVCIVLEPVGSAAAAVTMLELLEEVSGVKIFNNPEVQIQVCSPGRLSPKLAAILGAAFYLGSDQIKHFGPRELRTTQEGYTLDRLIIYDYKGVFDPDFTWWGTEKNCLSLECKLPFKNERTDILGCQSKLDIYNVNLVASLLVHAENDGFWSEAGKGFASEMRALFDQHLLSGVLDSVWVRQQPVDSKVKEWLLEDTQYFDHLRELMNYAFEEIGRIRSAQIKLGNTVSSADSILLQTKILLQRYQAFVASQTIAEEHDD